MLARCALDLYWMARYLARAQHLCRLLQLQIESLADRSVREIHYGWVRIYLCLGRMPPVGGLEFDSDEDFTLADSYTLAGDLTFEQLNPASVWSCLQCARENARQTRNYISGEMWQCINEAFLRIRDRNIEEFWETSRPAFYIETLRDIDTFTGVAEVTKHWDEGKRFIDLGQCVERIQLLAALLLAQTEGDRRSGGAIDSDWISLLDVYHGYPVYCQCHGVVVEPKNVEDVLVNSELLPLSLVHSLERQVAVLEGIGESPVHGRRERIVTLAQQARRAVAQDWPGCADREEFLRQVQRASYGLSDLVVDSYVNYELESA
ncbi:MAG: alpha-E domain-containing protein [Bryobacterales bacterium]|nr:alpha-E domain-containing protein [Bryobacterales bacterium]